MTREKLISREWHKKSPTYGHVTVLYLESVHQHKGNKQTNKREFSAKYSVFSAATSSEIKILKLNLKEFLEEQRLHLKKKKEHGSYFEVAAIQPLSATLT